MPMAYLLSFLKSCKMIIKKEKGYQSMEKKSRRDKTACEQILGVKKADR
jgi:hypothetical protein